jgi:hypothetical protein
MDKFNFRLLWDLIDYLQLIATTTMQGLLIGWAFLGCGLLVSAYKTPELVDYQYAYAT